MSEAGRKYGWRITDPSQDTQGIVFRVHRGTIHVGWYAHNSDTHFRAPWVGVPAAIAIIGGEGAPVLDHPERHAVPTGSLRVYSWTDEYDVLITTVLGVARTDGQWLPLLCWGQGGVSPDNDTRPPTDRAALGDTVTMKCVVPTRTKLRCWAYGWSANCKIERWFAGVELDLPPDVAALLRDVVYGT